MYKHIKLNSVYNKEIDEEIFTVDITESRLKDFEKNDVLVVDSDIYGDFFDNRCYVENGKIVLGLPLDEYKNVISDQLNYERNNRMIVGESAEFKIDDEYYTSNIDPFSFQIITGYLTLYNSVGDSIFPIVWRAKNNEYFKIKNKEELIMIGNMIGDSIKKIFDDSWVAKDKISKVNTFIEKKMILNDYLGIENPDLSDEDTWIWKK